MSENLTRKLIGAHLLEGTMQPGNEIGLRIDQTLTQDATGTLVMLELEALQVDQTQAELSAQYVDHNLIEEDHKNADDHLFLESACRRFGIWYSPAGNGVSHVVHQERFGKPGKTLLGSDSHTPAAGAIGMLAMGAGGLEVALAIAGQPFYVNMPKVWGIRVTGSLPDWVSAKDVVLELLRRHDVDGGRGCVLEYHGPGIASLSVMDRHVICNMGTELGATSSVFPADESVRTFLRGQQRESDYAEMQADTDCSYDQEEELHLDEIEPLVALPSSPGNVKPVREVAGQPVQQTYIGSSANPGYRDFAVAACMVEGKQIGPQVSFDINPTSRQVLLNLIRDGHLTRLLQAGARLHQTGCNGCIGMGQAPGTGRISLRTVPRNFPGRSGTRHDHIYLVSPETATASAITGKITDPRTLGDDSPRVSDPEHPVIPGQLFEAPLPLDEARQVELVKGPNIASLPLFERPPDELDLPVILKVQDGLSTDEIMPAGTRVLPYRSNIPKMSDFVFEQVDANYVNSARQVRDDGGHVVIAGENYGQGSSREHAALVPRYLGLRVVLAKSFARIHWQNLVNYGVLPLRFTNESDYDALQSGMRLTFTGLRQINDAEVLQVRVSDGTTITVRHELSRRQAAAVLAGGLINLARDSA